MHIFLWCLLKDILWLMMADKRDPIHRHSMQVEGQEKKIYNLESIKWRNEVPLALISQRIVIDTERERLSAFYLRPSVRQGAAWNGGWEPSHGRRHHNVRNFASVHLISCSNNRLVTWHPLQCTGHVGTPCRCVTSQRHSACVCETECAIHPIKAKIRCKTSFFLSCL